MSAASGLRRPKAPDAPALPAIREIDLCCQGGMVDDELRRSKGGADGARSSEMFQRTGATTSDPRWQVCRATLRHTAYDERSFARQNRTSTSSPLLQLIAILSGRRLGLAVMNACSTSSGAMCNGSLGAWNISGIFRRVRTLRTVAK